MSCAKTLLAIGLAFCAPWLAAGPGPSWPGDKPIRLIVPYPAGGNADMIGRVFARALGDRLGQTFVVDNRPGAGGSIGTGIAARPSPTAIRCCWATSPRTPSTGSRCPICPMTRSAISCPSRA